jgi:hypothetical protein
MAEEAQSAAPANLRRVASHRWRPSWVISNPAAAQRHTLLHAVGLHAALGTFACLCCKHLPGYSVSSRFMHSPW